MHMQTVSASFAEIVIQGIGEWFVMSAIAALLGAFCSRLHDIGGQQGAARLHAMIACIGVVLMMVVKPASDTQAGVLIVLVSLCLLLVPAVRFAMPRVTALQAVLRACGGDNFSAGAALFAGVACGSGETSAIVIMVLVIAFASVWRTAPRQENRDEAVMQESAAKPAAIKAVTIDTVVPKVVAPVATAAAPAAFSNVVKLEVPATFVRTRTALVLQDNDAPVQLAFNFAA